MKRFVGQQGLGGGQAGRVGWQVQKFLSWWNQGVPPSWDINMFTN